MFYFIILNYNVNSEYIYKLLMYCNFNGVMVGYIIYIILFMSLNKLNSLVKNTKDTQYIYIFYN